MSTFVYENQRKYVGLGWHASNPKTWPLDPPRFSTENNFPAEVDPSEPNWRVVVDETTDQNGWHYAFDFPTVTKQRGLGRATERSTDWVRRRKWVIAAQGKEKDLITNGLMADVTSLKTSVTASSIHSGYTEGESSSMVFWNALGQSSLGAHDMLIGLPAAIRVRRAHQPLYVEYLNKLKPVNLETDFLVEAAVAANYARASYGRLMEDGWLSTSAGVMGLNTYGKFGFDRRTGIDDKTNTDSLLKLTGLRRENIVYVCWVAPCHFVAIDHEMGWVVVAVRGTVSDNDVITDIKVQPERFMDGQAHGGFLLASAAITQAILPYVEAALKQHPTYKLVVTGHSLGGAVATLITIHLRQIGEPFENAICYGFCSAAVVSQNIASRCDFVNTFVYQRDPVPRLSIQSIDALFDELRQETSILRFFGYTSTPTPTSPTTPTMPTTPTLEQEHGNTLEPVASAPAATQSAPTPKTPQLFCAGNIIQIQADKAKEAYIKPDENGEEPAWWKMVGAGKTFFANTRAEDLTKLWFSFSVADDHVMDFLLKAILQETDCRLSKSVIAGAEHQEDETSADQLRERYARIRARMGVVTVIHEHTGKKGESKESEGWGGWRTSSFKNMSSYFTQTSPAETTVGDSSVPNGKAVKSASDEALKQMAHTATQ